ncbi:ABC transporter ATP-binding protein [Bacillus sp. AGMB 02131]|uniref:ABC transporter ATP-binding protein n=1 Tax=Peribacillus faecalis TaxID=2772559 RepID=A0A927CW85_9BACI|nr:ABC transporter ATP-binding protein [Peribacillus faecalis]MBD3108932.1 ABC transporter ATP-binding protein [Peribacillus faecalis]
MPLLTVHIEQAGYTANEIKLSEIDFTIEKGALVGLIGANGAGKSTTIKSILGLMPYMEGKISKEEGIAISYLPESPVFYDELTLQEHIDFIVSVEQMSDLQVEEQVNPLLKLFKMDKHVHQLPHTYSKGMQQKAMIILAFMTKPNILIIDEPFIGLDPIATRSLLELITKEREKGTGILMSTHVLDTAEKVCDSFVLIDSGRQIATGTLAQLQEQCGNSNLSLFDCYHHLVEDEGDE